VIFQENNMVKFNATRAEQKIITKIVDRAFAMAGNVGHSLDRMATDMDITACHCNGNPLRLQELLDADDFNFSHDVFGIQRHINRETGKLENCFLPRFTRYNTKPGAGPTVS
jgi:hypothetical protein